MQLEREEAQRQIEFERSEALRRQQLEEENRRVEMERRLLKDESERRQRELDHQIEMQQRITEMERLRKEVMIRENEEVRLSLGSDYESDDEREDVTRPVYKQDLTQKKSAEAAQSTGFVGYQPPNTPGCGSLEASNQTAGRNPYEVILKSKPQETANSGVSQHQSDIAMFSRVL